MKRPYSDYRASGVASTGDVPSHWRTVDLCRIGSFFKGGGGTKEDETEEGHPCIRYGDLYTRHDSHIRESRSRISPDRAAAYTQLQYGDLLLAGSGETLEEIGKSATNLLREPAFCGGDVIICRPEVDIDATFLGYAADCSPSRYQKSCMGRGVTVMHIYGSELKKLAIPVPPLEEQVQIGAYLDRETARIDKLITKQESLIERLDEYRTALVTKVVTKGLPPEAAEAAGLDPAPTLKDSGVEWLGEVPTHWEVSRLGWSLRDVIAGGTPDTGREDYWADVDEAGVPWVAIGDMSDGGVVPTTAKRVTPAGIRAARLRAIPSGTVIYSMYASVGATAVLSINAVTNQAILGLVPDSQLSSSFLYWWLTGIRSSVLSMVRSNTQSNLNAEIVRSLPLLLPSLTEQAAQTAFLDTQSQRIDALRAKAELSIERLREYRSALVSAAVAGKIDVREAALAGSGGGG